jgi:hypothetical protein
MLDTVANKSVAPSAGVLKKNYTYIFVFGLSRLKKVDMKKNRYDYGVPVTKNRIF